MTSQQVRPYRSSNPLVRGDAQPPAPGQAYFGYPQPSLVQFPMPQRTGVPLDRGRPFRAHCRASRSGSGVQLHLIGYSLAVTLGGVVGMLVGAGTPYYR